MAVESICTVLTEAGCQIAARTYRAWKHAAATGAPPAARTVSDAVLVDALLATADTPESLYGRRKMTAHLRRKGHRVAACTVDRLMRQLGMNGVVRAKDHRTTTPGKDGQRAGDLLDRDFSAPAPNHTWIADFTYVRTWAGFAYVAFTVDVYSQRIVGWHAMTTKVTELVLTCLRMATWRRGHDGHPVTPGMIFHSDAGSQGGLNWSTQHLDQEVDLGAWTRVDGDLDGAPVDAITGTAPGAPRHRTRLLAQDRRRTEQRRRRSRGGRVRARRLTVVPPRWRHGDDHPDRDVRALPLLRRT